tara:strand:- start:219 stop:1091 length:873 start_codon:yes stop_codon:yes gene_type:complete
MIPEKYRPLIPNHKYPPFLNGRHFEEYFYDFWQSLPDDQKEKLHYIDIYWLNLHKLGRFNRNEIQKLVDEECKIAKDNGKIPFTLCQWDDNIEIKKPENMRVYSIGTSKDVPMPLLVEDKTDRLLKVPRVSFKDKKYLASFVGTHTHNVRRVLHSTYKDDQDFCFKIRNGWTNVVPEELANLFITTTQESKFGLAPRGYGASSFRYFELIQMGVIPVYIHNGDNALPFQDEIDYSKFSVSVHIEDIGKLKDILESIDETKYTQMVSELQRVEQSFTLLESCRYVLRNLRR